MTTDSDKKERLPGCTHCNSDAADDEAVIHENGFDGYKCRDCDLIYISPRPDPSDVANLYDHDSAHVSAGEWIAASKSFGKRLKAKYSLKYIRAYRGSGDLLEIGAGGGAFLRQAAKYFRVHAAEFNPEQASYLNSSGVDCRQGEFSKTFSGMQFDVIYHCDVLSHFADPVKEFVAMRDMLKPGGIIVFETGNLGDLATRYYHLIDRWQYPDHLYFFSKKSLENLESAANLQRHRMIEHSRAVEMRLDNVLKSAKTSVKSLDDGASGNSSGRAKSLIRRIAMNLKHTVDFLLIYRLGKLLPRAKRPQTVIVILRA